MLVWSFCGLFSLLGALCFAELGTTINKSGGEYTYILETYGDLAGFLYLWVGMLVVAPTARAIMALTFSSYLLSFFAGPDGCKVDDRTVLLLAASCLCKWPAWWYFARTTRQLNVTNFVTKFSQLGLLTYVNCASVKWAMRIQDFFTITKFFALTVFMSIGIYSYYQGRH